MKKAALINNRIGIAIFFAEKELRMEKEKEQNTLPKWCHAVLPQDGSLVIITYGEPGYKRSPLESKDREENRRIADRENAKIGKITLQQEKTMIAGALLGWKPLSGMQETHIDNEPWELLVIKEDVDGKTHGSVLDAPAAPYDIFDALDRAYVPGEVADIQVEIREGGLPCLDQRIDPHTNIFELNDFIKRYFQLDERGRKCFQGQIEMELQGMESGQKIPIDRLINLTGSAGNCELYDDVHTDYQLGKYAVEHRMVKELESMPEALREMLDYESIGRKKRHDDKGIFTDCGYVSRKEYVKDIYSAEAIPREKPDYMIKMLITHDKGTQSELKLPTNDLELAKAYIELGLDDYSKLDGCRFAVEDCAIPWMKKMLNDELNQTDYFGHINEFARQLEFLERNGNLLSFKALLDEAPADISLDEVIDLTKKTVKFRLERSLKTPSDYAVESLAEKGIDINETMINGKQLMEYGETVVAEKGIVLTEYGDLVSKTGETIEDCMGREEQGMIMEP